VTRRKSGPKQRRKPSTSGRQQAAVKRTAARMRARPKRTPTTAAGHTLATIPGRANGKHFPIVGIGASAGGLEAFVQLLEHLKPDTGMGFVYVQHLDRHHDSMLTALLAKSAGMPVHEARDGMPVQPNHIYVISPNTSLGISAGKLTVTARGDVAEPNMSVDHFLRALAHDCGNQAIGVILSGTASDGTHGLRAIKQEGGLTFAQSPDSAKHDGMPRSAIASGCVDFVQMPTQIAGELRRSLTLAQEARDYAQAIVEFMQEPLLALGG